MDKVILHKFLKSGFIETGKLFPTDKGTPQGGAISPTICNMVLDGLEKALKRNNRRRFRNGVDCNPKVNFIRYADDFIVTGVSKEILNDSVLPVIKEFLGKRGLELSKEKTIITNIEDGFNFLGCNIRTYDGKLLIKPSKDNIKAFLHKVRLTIKQLRTAKQEDLIRRVNPIIQGWVNFQRYNVSKKAFSYVDFQIWKSLWQWAKRRHKQKGKRWIAKKYFHQILNRSWAFCVPTKKQMENGEPYHVKLIYASDINIVRFTKIKSEANPYDKAWQTYFEERATDKMRISLKGRKVLTKLFHQQKGRCFACGEKLTVHTGCKVHETSTEGLSVKTLVHPDCHRQIHSLKTEQLVLSWK